MKFPLLRLRYQNDAAGAWRHNYVTMMSAAFGMISGGWCHSRIFLSKVISKHFKSLTFENSDACYVRQNVMVSLPLQAEESITDYDICYHTVSNTMCKVSSLYEVTRVFKVDSLRYWTAYWALFLFVTLLLTNQAPQQSSINDDTSRQNTKQDTARSVKWTTGVLFPGGRDILFATACRPVVKRR